MRRVGADRRRNAPQDRLRATESLLAAQSPHLTMMVSTRYLTIKCNQCDEIDVHWHFALVRSCSHCETSGPGRFNVSRRSVDSRPA